MNLDAPVNTKITGLKHYQPGKPIDEVARELGLNDIVKLASNENPRGPGEKVQQAIAQVSKELSRYPDGGGFEFKSALAQHTGVDTNQLTLGNGSNDVLDRIAREVVEPGYEAIISEHSFVVYRLAVTCCGVQSYNHEQNVLRSQQVQRGYFRLEHCTSHEHVSNFFVCVCV